MSGPSYFDFELLIQPSGDGTYRAKVVGSPGGEASVQFKQPFSELELENLLLRIGRQRGLTRRIDSPELDAVKTFGGRLFKTVFKGEVLGCLERSLDETVHQPQTGLRVRLRLTEVPELADLPWEYLYNPAINSFLALSVETPLVRYLELPRRITPLKVSPPLRILVMISSPNDYPKLDVEHEWSKLQTALGDLVREGRVSLQRLSIASLAALQRQLTRDEYHVFHFIGHGGFDRTSQDGLLVLEDEFGKGRPVSGQDVAMILHDENTLRLAVLNACEGARSSRTDPFAGSAQSLVQQGIPAVIAMQFEISDRAAVIFAHEFYSQIALGYSVDAALSEARKAIFADGNALEWGTPVLYLRSPDGRVFDVAGSVPSALVMSPVEPTAARRPPLQTGLDNALSWAWYIPIILATMCCPPVGLIAGGLLWAVSTRNKSIAKVWFWLGVVLLALYSLLIYLGSLVPTDDQKKQTMAPAPSSSTATTGAEPPTVTTSTESPPIDTKPTNYEDAVATYRRQIEQHPEMAATFYEKIGILMAEHDRHSDAVEAFLHVLQSNPQNANIHERLGDAYRESGQSDKALAAYKKAIALDPKEAGPFNGIGILYENSGRIDEAIAAYKKAIAVDGQSYAPHHNLGLLYARLGRYSDAIASYCRATEINKQDWAGFYNLADLYRSSERYEESLRAYKRVLELKKDDSDTYNAIGILYRDWGKYADAMTAFKRAIELDPKSPYPYKNLSGLYEKLGRYDEAADVLRRGHQSHP